MTFLDLLLVFIFLLILLILFLWLVLHVRILESYLRKWPDIVRKKFLYILIIIEVVVIIIIYQRVVSGGMTLGIPLLQKTAGLNPGGTIQTQSTGDYLKDVENCNALLYKSPSNSIYCYVAINADLGGGVVVEGAGIFYEPTTKRTEKLFEQQYQATLRSFREQEESAGSQPGWEKGVLTEEPGPGGIKLIINKHANIKKGSGFAYEFSGEAFLQQGTCVLEISGDALNRTGDLDGDLGKLKEALFGNTEKVSSDFSKYCKN